MDMEGQSDPHAGMGKLDLPSPSQLLPPPSSPSFTLPTSSDPPPILPSPPLSPGMHDNNRTMIITTIVAASILTFVAVIVGAVLVRRWLRRRRMAQLWQQHISSSAIGEAFLDSRWHLATMFGQHDPR